MQTIDYPSNPPGRRDRWVAARDFFGLNRNVGVLAASVFGLALGEELWQAYLPAYLTALGASGLVVGIFASMKDFLDGAYQYPGGWMTDRFGRRPALMAFTVIAIAGYATYALASHWAMVFVGLTGVMAWKSGAFPATFAVIGDALPPGRRATAFGVQSVLVRLPRVIGAPLGGLLVGSLGILAGIRVSLAVTLAIALTVLLIQHRGLRDETGSAESYAPVPVMRVLAQMPEALKRLLIADCLVRIGEGLAAAFIVLYVTQTLGFSAPAYGLLYALQHSVAIASYLPGGKAADLTGRRPIVALTFAFFALFPLAVALSQGFASLMVAFLIGGLKEIGEPARKSLIVDLSSPAQRGRAVGAYYTIRNLLIVPAGTLGGILWERAPYLPLETAFVVGLVGVVVFLWTSRGSRTPDRAEAALRLARDRK